ncbi:ABC transporter permease [Chitinasiproducens palmae]|uniref:ABC transporter permease n=1 Tax=Chitinasiproducens palmae TaxID=1770053 RepID=UPI002E258D4F
MTRALLTLLVGALLFALAAAGLYELVGADAFADYQDDLAYYAQAHMLLVLKSMGLALLVGIPSGILLSRPAMRGSAERLMQVFNLGNTLPSLAVLALAMAFLGIGERPAILALWLASLLPIVRNTYAGLRALNPALLEASRAMGMTPRQALFGVELPNALPVLMAGVRTALTINVGTAPLAFLIGADSFGSLIFPGIYLNDFDQLLIGASCTALLAIALDALIAWSTSVWLARRGLAR